MNEENKQPEELEENYVPMDGEFEEETWWGKIKQFFKNALNYTVLSSGREFNDFEYKIIRCMFKCFASYDIQISSWLFQYIDYNKVKFKWNYNLHKSGIMGAFSPLFPNTISVGDSGFFTVTYPEGSNRIPGDNDYIIISRPSMDGSDEVKVSKYDINAGMVSTLVVNFPTLVHEMTHMFQFGLPCRIIEGMTFKDIILLKVIMPVGYVFNRLITAIIDNPIVDAICVKAHELKHPDDFEWNSDDAHLPYLYKITLEHDVDKMIEENPKLKDFSEHLTQCISAREFQARNDVSTNPDRAEFMKGWTEEERQSALESYNSVIEGAIKEHGQVIWDFAGELIQICKEERDRILAEAGYKKEK